MTAIAHRKPHMERIDLRTSANTKRLIVKASALAGVSVSTFMLNSALERAQQMLAQHEALTLSAQDWDKFVSVIDNPPPPNPRLKTAMKKHLAKVG